MLIKIQIHSCTNLPSSTLYILVWQSNISTQCTQIEKIKIINNPFVCQSIYF